MLNKITEYLNKMKKNYLSSRFKKALLFFAVLFYSLTAFSQANINDNIIVVSSNYIFPSTAINSTDLDNALQNSAATLTVFTPDNNAFDNLAAELNTNIAGLLALPNPSDILLYHVLGFTSSSASITNSQIVQLLSADNTIKLTKISTSDVYAKFQLIGLDS